MLSVSGPTFVLWVHIVAACIWIGGQMTVAAIIPLLRDHRALARHVGRRYQLVAWPAFAVLIITGVLNASEAGYSSAHHRSAYGQVIRDLSHLPRLAREQLHDRAPLRIAECLERVSCS